MMERDSIKEDLSIADIVKKTTAAPNTTPASSTPTQESKPATNDLTQLDNAERDLLAKDFDEMLKEVE